MEYYLPKRCCRCKSICLKTNSNGESKNKAGFQSQFNLV